MPFLLALGLSPRVLAFAGLISLLAVTVSTLPPALHLALTNLREILWKVTAAQLAAVGGGLEASSS
jgi:hypothetical protein